MGNTTALGRSWAALAPPRLLQRPPEVENESFSTENRPKMRQKSTDKEKKQKAVVATVHGLLSALEGFTGFKGRDVSLTRSIGKNTFTSSADATRVGFNPYKYTSFVDAETETPLATAKEVYINNTGNMQAWGVL